MPGCNGAVPCTTTTALLKTLPDYSILLAALEATGLNTTLDDYNLRATIFAPNNTGEPSLPLQSAAPSLCCLGLGGHRCCHYLPAVRASACEGT